MRIVPGEPMTAHVAAAPLARSGTPASLVHDGRFLVARFDRPHDVVSFAITGGGFRVASAVAWHEVTDGDLRPPVEPRALLNHALASIGLSGAVGLLTSRRLDRFVDVTHTFGGSSCRAVATVGLGNALRIGDSPGPSGRVGTINILCQVGEPLTREGLLEALTLAVEARTAAVLDADIESRRSGLRATGTGTDCLVVAAPRAARKIAYAGKHTAIGHVVGAAVYDAVARGAAVWKEDRASWPAAR